MNLMDSHFSAPSLLTAAHECLVKRCVKIISAKVSYPSQSKLSSPVSCKNSTRTESIQHLTSHQLLVFMRVSVEQRLKLNILFSLKHNIR